MTTLRDRLADLAEDAPSALPMPALWDRGRRYRRRRRAGAAVVLTVAAVALVVLGSVTWLRSPSAVEPLPADSPGGMPDHLYSASEWLPGTDDAGPLGPIAALVPAVRHTWSGEEDAILGVSASTGTYRFLDLPGLATTDLSIRPPWSLSPDGRYVAYLYRAPGAGLPPAAATGVALYDTSTGDVRRHPLSGDLGIRQLAWYWTASDTVVLDYGPVVVADGSGWQQARHPLVWNVHVERPHDLVTAEPAGYIHGAGPGFVELGTRQGAVRVDPATGTVLRHLAHRTPEGFSDSNGSRVASVDDGGTRDGTGDRVVVRPFPHDAGPWPAGEPVPGVDNALAVLSWIDDARVSLLRGVDAGQPDGYVVVDAVDVESGDSHRLTRLDSGSDHIELATDLLARPTVPGIEPPRPLDPRMVTAGVVVVVLAAGGALIAWRRRVRP